MKNAYCPACGADITPQDIEFITDDIYWSPCHGYRCRLANVSIKSDDAGFVMSPADYKGRYIYTRPERTT